MTSFEELGLSPEVVETLGARGLETPSAFQAEAIPVVLRANNLVALAGPGAGTLVAYGAPLLDRLPSEQGAPVAVILAPDRERATELARSLGGLARAKGHVVAALGGTWALPERSDLLFATPTDLLETVRDSRVKLESVEALVLDGGAAICELEGLEAVETLAGLLPADGQRIVLSLPLPEELDSFVEGHVKRPIRLPPAPSGEGDGEEHIPHRGTLTFRVVEGGRTTAAIRAVDALLDQGARHVLVHFHSDDEAADVGDELTLQGYVAGAPGDVAVPVWLGTDAAASRKLLDGLDDAEDVATLSFRVPLDPDDLDRRHARGGGSMTLLRARELPHLEEAARVAGYRLEAAPDEAPLELTGQIAAFQRSLEETLEEKDLAPYLLLVEPLIERHGAARVAAAAAALLRARRTAEEAAAPAESESPPSKAPPGEAGWVRLFMSLGHKDEVGPGDVLGAITGEAGVEGSRVGRIDIRDTFSLVEVDRSVAKKVIDAMNGITVKGRSVRVDYDRPRSGRNGPGRGSGRGKGRHGR